MLRDGLKDIGVDVSSVAITPGPSGVAIIHVDELGENSIVIISGANGQVEAVDLEKLETALIERNFYSCSWKFRWKLWSRRRVRHMPVACTRDPRPGTCRIAPG